MRAGIATNHRSGRRFEAVDCSEASLAAVRGVLSAADVARLIRVAAQKEREIPQAGAQAGSGQHTIFCGPYVAKQLAVGESRPNLAGR